MDVQLLSGPIGRKMADQEIKKYIELTTPANNIFYDIVKVFGNNSEFNNFYSNRFNAFVFSKEDILKFFDTKEGSSAATHLMVILGAVSEGASGTKAGTPTVIVTGVIPDTHATTGSNTVERYKTSIKGENPASQYPTKFVVSELPNEVVGEHIIFTVE